MKYYTQKMVNAIQFTDDSFDPDKLQELHEFFAGNDGIKIIGVSGEFSDKSSPYIIKIPRPMGEVVAEVGDYVIKDDNEFSVVKPHIFELVYKPVPSYPGVRGSSFDLLLKKEDFNQYLGEKL